MVVRKDSNKSNDYIGAINLFLLIHRLTRRRMDRSEEKNHIKLGALDFTDTFTIFVYDHIKLAKYIIDAVKAYSYNQNF